MLKTIFPFLFLLINPGNTLQPPLPICVVGGGISGLAMSKLLQDKGYPVKLFEKDNRWGGKVSTYKSPDNDIILEKGAVVYGPHQYYIKKYLTDYNVSSVPYDFYDFALLDPKTAGRYRYIMNKQQWGYLTESFSRVEELIWEGDAKEWEMGFTDLPLDSDLALPYGEWLEEHGLHELHVAASIVGTTTGYGDVDEVPTIYYLRLMRPNDTASVFRNNLTWFTAKEGYDILIDRMADAVQEKFLGHEAVSIVRGLDEQTLRFLVNKKYTREEKCRKTILTFAPLMKDMRIIRDLSSEEEALFSQVKIHKYVSSGHVIPAFFYNNYFGFTPKTVLPEGREIFPYLKYPEGNGDFVMFAKGMGSKNPHAYVGYWWIAGDYDRGMNSQELKMVSKKMDNLVKRAHPFGQTLFMENWEYFPHVTTASIRNGFYKKFDKLQGKDGLYFASVLLTFEMMDPALEMAEKFVQKYF